ncbi:UNVERIFIED_CONTAM: hypothetical protein GTU68_066066 [Idotea baltica]|nr:hypothetical protein [Idotea baltica]
MRLFFHRNGFGEAKRSFDEINRSSFGFNKRRNFDEIGRSSFGFNKRRNFDEINRSSFGFNKRRNFDEIGRSSFGFNKRESMRNSEEIDALDDSGLEKRGDFDEIGRSSFGFYRRSPEAPRALRWRFFSRFGKRDSALAFTDSKLVDSDTADNQKRSFDEINRSRFGFNSRSVNGQHM